MKLRKSIAGAAIAAVLAIGATVPASAHDGWTQTNTPIAAPGQTTYVELMLGNHSNDHKSYRIAGQWSPDTTKVYVTTPAGVKADITGTRFYAGESATETEPAVNNYFVASFKSAVPGAYIVSAEGDSVFKHGETASRTLRSAKSFAAVADIPVAARVKALQGFARQVSPDRAELIPLFNPAAVHPGQEIAVQLLLKGEPLPDTGVDVIRRSTSEAVELVTDQDGIVKLEAGAADYYLVRAKPSAAEGKEGEYSVTNYEATMTFTVQNETPDLPGSPSNAAPLIYVNADLFLTGSKLVGGTTMVDASFVREHIDPEFKGEGMTSLRAAAEAAGLNVEYFPAAGANRAAVAVYAR